MYKVTVWSWVQIPEFSFWYSFITCVLSLQTFHPISWIRKIFVFLYINYLPIIMGYDTVKIKYVVVGSKPVVVILIQWHYVCFSCKPFTQFCEYGQKLVPFKITGPSIKYKCPIRATMWFYVQSPSYELFVCCYIIVLWHWSDQILLILILVIGCCIKLSVGRDQPVLVDLLAPQAWGSLCRGCRLGVHTIHASLIARWYYYL